MGLTLKEKTKINHWLKKLDTDSLEHFFNTFPKKRKSLLQFLYQEISTQIFKENYRFYLNDLIWVSHHDHNAKADTQCIQQIYSSLLFDKPWAALVEKKYFSIGQLCGNCILKNYLYATQLGTKIIEFNPILFLFNIEIMIHKLLQSGFNFSQLLILKLFFEKMLAISTFLSLDFIEIEELNEKMAQLDFQEEEKKLIIILIHCNFKIPRRLNVKKIECHPHYSTFFKTESFSTEKLQLFISVKQAKKLL